MNVPAGAMIVDAYLDMMGVACSNTVNVNGTGFAGVDTGDAIGSTHYINPYPPYNDDAAAWAGLFGNYCNERYDIKSMIVAGANTLIYLALSSHPIFRLRRRRL